VGPVRLELLELLELPEAPKVPEGMVQEERASQVRQ
jgi:hypothetical protein